MKLNRRILSVAIQSLTGAMLLGLYAVPALAQDRAGEDIQKLNAVEVTGSRIKKAEVEGQTPVLTITAQDIAATGLGSIGDVIQRLSVSGSSLNTKFNSAGNFGFPPDGGGVGSGSTTISLRNLGAKRTLVLVDGLRWVNESSASGVSAAVDLNTIPSSIVERIEILTDGASSLYGSDAIAGVINIITKKKDDGLGFHVYGADYSVGDGKTYSGNVSLGGTGERYTFFMDISRFKQHEISSADFAQSAFPTPGIGGQPNPLSWSSATPFTRILFDTPGGVDFGGLCPDGFCSITANGVAPASGIQPFPSGYHHFTTADRFNYAPYNLLLTPSERTGVFAQGTYAIADNVNFYMKGLYNTRDSKNQAGPEPIFLGQQFCQAIDRCYGVGVDATNPYNPFGFSLDGNSSDFGLGRRPVEGGPRIFSQTVDTKYWATGFNGSFGFGDHQYFWDVNYVNSSNRATQTVNGTYNIRHIQEALGPIDTCLADAACVPLNIFGGPGTITRPMLDYILFTEQDRSEQKLEVWTANISGDLFQLPAGALSAATGFEHRHVAGFYRPDSIVTAGDSNGVPSGPTQGAYDVDEYYLELNAPILADLAFAKHLDLSAATRYSDYSNFGGTTNNKLGVRWQVVDDLTLRGTWAEGFRAPSIGELFGTFSRFDASIIDPCGGNVTANCATLGVPAGFVQNNPQISIITGGNQGLKHETSKSVTAGAVYSPSWAENTAWSSKVDFELTYYRHKIKDAIQAPSAQTQLNRCVETTDPVFCNGITRAGNGAINGFNNTLRNLGKINTEGYDFGINWTGNESDWGRFGASLQTTYTSKYSAVATDSGAREPNGVGIETSDSGIPRYRSTLNLKWALADFSAQWTVRYLSRLTEDCGNAGAFAVCSEPNNTSDGRVDGTHHLGAVTYHDARVTWKLPTSFDASVSGGINNIFEKDPPICLSCSLNGYDASNYDLPGRFAYIEASVKFH